MKRYSTAPYYTRSRVASLLASSTRLIAAVINISRTLRLSAYFCVRSFDHSLKRTLPSINILGGRRNRRTIEVQPINSWKTEVPQDSRSTMTRGCMLMSYDWLGK